MSKPSRISARSPKTPQQSKSSASAKSLAGKRPSEELSQRLRRAIRELGTTYTPGGYGQENSLNWELLSAPLALAKSDWQMIEAAVVQRARFANVLLRDLYGEKRSLASRLIAPELIFADPFYRRPMHGQLQAHIAPAAVLRFDLVRTEELGWIFAETFANTPLGFSFAVQNRRLMTHEAPEVYEGAEPFASIVNFPLQLIEHLKRLAPAGRSNPSVVLLSSGPGDPLFIEHGFLARKMGIPLARGEDLIVVDDALFLRTIAGLQRVDVVYRRLNDAHIDPVAMPTPREPAGVPALMHCVRRGTVALANSIGSGLVENRAFAALTRPLMRSLLGEKPLLPDWPTFYCGDKDQLDFVLSSSREFFFQRTSAAFSDSNCSLESVRAAPFEHVAKKKLQLSGTPQFPEAGELRLACYALCEGEHVHVLPGALAMFGNTARDNGPGLTTDVLVPSRSEATHTNESTPVIQRADTRQATSRTAECLYWLGRYIERAEGAARRLALFEEVGLEEIPAGERPKWFPLWQGILESTGQKLTRRITRLPFTERTAHNLALDPDHPGSILSCVRSATWNGRLTRDCLSPEAWLVLSRLNDRLQSLAQKSSKEPVLGREPRQAAVAAVVADIPGFVGTADRTMLHDAAWHFLQMGMHLERAVMTSSTLRFVLSSVGAHQQLGDRENPELSALLRMLQSQDAYRRLFQTRSDPRCIAELFLKTAEAPRSMLFCLRRIELALIAVGGDMAHERHPVHRVRALCLRLGQLNLPALFAEESDAHAGKVSGELLEALFTELLDLHTEIGDFFLSHQAHLVFTPADRGDAPFAQLSEPSQK